MPAPLTLTDCYDAYDALRAPLRVDLGFDRDTVVDLVRDHAELIRTTATRTANDQVLTLTTHLVATCAGLGMLGGDLDSRFGLAVADTWLSRNGYVFVPADMSKVRLLEALSRLPKRPARPSEAQLDAVRQQVGSVVVEVGSGAPLAGSPAQEPVDGRRTLRAFVACPLTSVPGEQVDMIDDMSGRVASVMAEFGVLTIQPVLYTSPTQTPVDVNDPVYRSIDEGLIAGSDIVVVVAARLSLGLGVVASTAQRYRKHLIVATSAPVVTPMITGLEPTPTIIRLDAVEPALRQHLAAVLPAIEENSRLARQTIAEIETELARLRVLIGRLPAGDVDHRPRGHILNRARLRELTNRPELLAGATFLEVRELYALIGELIGE